MDVGGILKDRPMVNRIDKEKSKSGSLKSSGFCHHCENDLPSGKVFCGDKCKSRYRSA